MPLKRSIAACELKPEGRRLKIEDWRLRTND
jgi:hypothetical protein